MSNIRQEVIDYFKKKGTYEKYKEDGSLARRIATGVQMAKKARGIKDEPKVQPKSLQETIEEMAEGIENKKEKAAFLATIKEETGFKAKEENLNYSADKLIEMRELWKATKNTNQKQGFSKLEGMSDTQINELVDQGPEAIANKIYGGRLGNAPDEGYKYRGRGLFQITGKENYSKLSKEIFPEDPDKLINNPDLINDPETIKRAAKSYWQKNIKEKVDFENTPTSNVMQKVTNVINPGTDTKDRRNKYFGEYFQQFWNEEADIEANKQQSEWNKEAMEANQSKPSSPMKTLQEPVKEEKEKRESIQKMQIARKANFGIYG